MAVDNPINLAYSTDELAIHMDLVYYESPPGLQLLHCIRSMEIDIYSLYHLGCTLISSAIY